MSSSRALFVLICALPALLAGQTSPTSLCDPPEPLYTSVQEAYYVPEQVNGKRRSQDDIMADRKARIASLLEKTPNDFWVLRTYIDTTRKGSRVPESVIEEFRKRCEAKPSDPEAAYLHGYALMHTRTPEAIKVFDKILETTPEFPKIWYAFTQIYASRAFQDKGKNEDYTRRYVNRCASSNSAAGLMLRLDKPDNLDAFVKAFRERIAGKPQSEVAELHSILWKLEFRLAPIAEHPKVREHVAQDLKFLAGLDPDKYRMLNYVLREGYKLTGDKAEEERLSELLDGGPSIATFISAQEAWNKANPATPGDDEEKRKVRSAARLKFLNEWIVKLPDEDFVRMERLRILLEAPSVTDEAIVEEGERVLEASRRKVSSIRSPQTTPMQVASIWASRGIQLDRIPALIKEGLALAARQNERPDGPPQSDMYPSPDRGAFEAEQAFYTNTFVWQVLAAAYSKGGKYAEARGVLAKWDAGLAERRKLAEEYSKAPAAAPGPKPDPDRMRREALVRNLPVVELQYQAALAQLAAAEGRKLDALTFYQAALRARVAQPLALDAAKSELARKAGVLWKELGGTQEGWQVWLDSLKTTVPANVMDRTAFDARWSSMKRPLTGFELRDQAGKTWTIAAIKGKTTLLNVWATWCGPCRAELPFLQKLHDTLKGRTDIQVITLNVDDNLGLVEPFLAEQKYTFPVLLAKTFVDNFAGPLGVPTNWIANREATVELEAVGFGGDGDEWVKQTLAKLESVH